MSSRLGLPTELAKQRAARQRDGTAAIALVYPGEAAPDWGLVWLFVAILGSYLLLAFIYEQCRQRRRVIPLQPHTQELLPGLEKPAKPASKPRYQEWDFMKLVMQVLVVANHTDLMLCLNEGWEYPGVIIEHWPAAFKMNTLVFISGVFGSSIERGSMYKMLCYTLGTMTLFGTLNYCIFQKDIWLGWFFWYMWTIFTCRTMVSPAFYLCRQHGIPLVVPLCATLVICYTLMRLDYESESSSLRFALTFIRESNFYAPYFALGLCLPLKKWHALMQDARVAALCAMLLAVWWWGIWHWPAFQQWADSACTLHEQCRQSGHFPDSVYPPHEIAWTTFYDWVRVFCQKAVVGCAVLCVLGKSVQPLSYVLPMESICAIGSRTVYSYELHLFVILWLGMVMHLDRAMHTIPDEYWPAFCIAFGAVIAMTLSCSLTERLFKWLVVPYWMLDVPGIAVKLWSKAIACAHGERAVA